MLSLTFALRPCISFERELSSCMALPLQCLLRWCFCCIGSSNFNPGHQTISRTQRTPPSRPAAISVGCAKQRKGLNAWCETGNEALLLKAYHRFKQVSNFRQSQKDSSVLANQKSSMLCGEANCHGHTCFMCLKMMNLKMQQVPAFCIRYLVGSSV